MSGTLLNALRDWFTPSSDTHGRPEHMAEERFWLDRGTSDHWPDAGTEHLDAEDKHRVREFQVLMSCWM